MTHVSGIPTAISQPFPTEQAPQGVHCRRPLNSSVLIGGLAAYFPRAQGSDF